MLGRSKARLYERLLDEKDAQIRILISEVNGYRMQQGRVGLPMPLLTDSVGPLPTAPKSDEPLWESEAEEAEKILAADPTLSKVHLSEILDGLGYGNSDLS